MNTKTTYDFEPVEARWRLQWDQDRLYEAQIDLSKPKYYCLDTWAYPSSEGVHIGYVKSFGGMDIIARFKRMKGFNVLYPGGWDTFGLPAENFAIKSGRHPREISHESIGNFRAQFKAFGLSYDWSREMDTADPEYYKWTQWVFLVMFQNGLAYRKKSAVNWCPNDKTVLANEQVINGKCERCGADVVQKELMQWFFRVSGYSKRLIADSNRLNWDEKYLNIHKKWLDGVRDWVVSRQRYWGPPIPIIYCDQCGTVPVPEADLPVLLPYDVDFTPTGAPPLAKNEKFVNTNCPQCGGKATREVDILDTFVSSAWYELRFTDPHNPNEFASKPALAYWRNVDHYQGAIEHLTAHLVYARFVAKVLFDSGYIPFDEPFPKYTPVGLLVDKTGTKFSKRLGNAPNTDELLKKYGGDLLRLSTGFITPFGDISRWGESDLVGLKKFRDRVWRVFMEKVDGKHYEMPLAILKQLHRLIKTVEENIGDMKFNVAISHLMVFIGALTNYEGKVDRSVWETFTKVLAPFAPFITEEMWHQIGNQTSVHQESWPRYDPKLARSDLVEISVQINGKFRGTVEVPYDASQAEVETAIFNSNLQTLLNKKILKKIFIANKTINFLLE
jgi:leucyl-tRNA synthetase